MKNLLVPYLPISATHVTGFWSALTAELAREEAQPLQAGWVAQYPYQPRVTFQMGHGGDCLYVRYQVQEAAIRAHGTRANDPVYEDSCVEIFLALDEVSYYNLEFNCVGTCLMEFGAARQNRQRAPAAVIETIRRQAVITHPIPGAGQLDFTWQLLVVIPVAAFWQHAVPSLRGQRGRVNFQKCGDQLPTPHFLVWSPIDTPAPDFHQPAFFGEIQFE